MACTGIARPIVTGVPCGLVKKGSLLVVDPVQAIDHDQLLLRDSYAAHYTTAEWSGFEHLLKDQKTTVGTLRTPRAGRCWLFDGTDDIATASTALLTGTGDFTICAWLKASSVSTGHIAGNYATGNSGGVQFALNTGKLQLYLGSALVGSTTLSTNTWYHVAVVRQSGVVTLYLDAVADGSGTRSNSITGSTNFSFGAITAGGERLSGKLRDLRVYSSAKTASEILAIKNQADTPGTYDTTGLLGAWWCEEESGTTGYDWSGNGRHLTLTNITQSTFHATDSGVTYNDANVRGARMMKRLAYVSGASLAYNRNGTWVSQIPISGDFDITFKGSVTPTSPIFGVQAESTAVQSNNYQQQDIGVGADTTTLISVYVNYGPSTSSHTVAAFSYTDITCRLVRSGTTCTIYWNGVLVTTKTITSSDVYVTISHASPNEIYVVYNNGVNIEQDNITTGSSLSSTMIVVPAVSDTLAADGNALTHTGKCPQPGAVPQKVATFDGANDYATRGARLTSGALSSFTFSCWMKCPAWGGGTYTIASEYTAVGDNRCWAVYFNGSGGVILLYSADGATQSSVNTGVTVTANRWTHLAFTYGSSTFKVYKDGLPISSDPIAASLFNTTAPFLLGGYQLSNTFYGSVSDARMYSDTKTDAEIIQIYRNANNTTNLLGRWPCCEGPGSGNTNTTIYDVSGNAKHLTVTNATIASFWADATDANVLVENYPLKYGYTVNGSGVIVPALLSGATDAAGNAIGTAAGKWKSGLQNINCLPYTNPLGVNIGLETALDPTADRKTTSSSKRRRRNTSGLYDRIGARATAMSDSTSNTYFGD